MRVFADPGFGGVESCAPALVRGPHNLEIGRVIGVRIRRRRRRLGLNQSELARRCGVCFQQIQKYEDGGTLSVARLMRIAVALEISIAYFFEGLERQPE